jgi:hypothetical protein
VMACVLHDFRGLLAFAQVEQDVGLFGGRECE